MKIKDLIKAHHFFVRESKLYCGKLNNPLFNNIVVIKSNIKTKIDLSKQYKYNLKHILYYPIAYIRFMYSTV